MEIELDRGGVGIIVTDEEEEMLISAAESIDWPIEQFMGYLLKAIGDFVKACDCQPTHEQMQEALKTALQELACVTHTKH